MCRRDFGDVFSAYGGKASLHRTSDGCMNLFENIELNKKLWARNPESVRGLKRLERHLRKANLDNEHLRRHVGLCRTFLKEPEHCGN